MRGTTSKSTFRCPFEMKAEATGTILEVSLGDAHQIRLEIAQKAYETFFTKTELVALKFILPDTVMKSNLNFETLKIALAPYQYELCAAELACRLSPFLLPSQSIGVNHTEMANLIDERKEMFTITTTLKKIFSDEELPEPETLNDMYQLYKHLFNPMVMENAPHPSISLLKRIGREKRKLAILYLEGADFAHEGEGNFSDKASNRNCFSIVKCPLYPEGVGRYSKNLEIVLTRQADLAMVSDEEAKKIQGKSNRALCDHGINVENTGSEKHHAGLWIPPT